MANSTDAIMEEYPFLSPETREFVDAYHRRLLILDELPDTAQLSALVTEQMTNEILQAVATAVQKRPAVLSLQIGKPVLVEFCAGECTVSSEALASARAILNSSGYSLLAGKVSRDSYRLLVKRHSMRRRRQSRLFWASPAAVAFMTTVAWERLLHKLPGGSVKARTSKSGAVTRGREASKPQPQRAALKKSADGQKHDKNPAAPPFKTSSQYREERREKKKAKMSELAEANWRQAVARGEQGIGALLSLDELPVGAIGWVQPWALNLRGDTCWFHTSYLCCDRREGAFTVLVTRTRRDDGLAVRLPSDLSRQSIGSPNFLPHFLSDQQEFEWFSLRPKRS